MIVNKIVLTTWRFPSALFLALGQFLFTALCILVLSSWPCRRATVRPCDRHIFRTIAPLAVLLSVNVIAGLVATRLLNLAMFGALRRVSILLTMLLEWFIVGVAATPSCGTAASVLIMLAGAFVAAVHDLSFVLYGCVRVH